MTRFLDQRSLRGGSDGVASRDRSNSPGANKFDKHDLPQSGAIGVGLVQDEIQRPPCTEPGAVATGPAIQLSGPDKSELALNANRLRSFRIVRLLPAH